MPPELKVFAALYVNLENATFLKDQLLSGNVEFEYAFIDASMVLSTKHVLAAAFRAINDYLNDALKSRNVHSEIVFSLSPNNNIGEAFRKFGIGDTTRSLIVLKVSKDVSFESVDKHLNEHIRGTLEQFDDEKISAVSEINKIRKAYKLAPSSGSTRERPSKPGVNGEASTITISQRSHLEKAVLGAMALRGAA